MTCQTKRTLKPFTHGAHTSAGSAPAYAGRDRHYFRPCVQYHSQYTYYLEFCRWARLPPGIAATLLSMATSLATYCNHCTVAFCGNLGVVYSLLQVLWYMIHVSICLAGVASDFQRSAAAR